LLHGGSYRVSDQSLQDADETIAVHSEVGIKVVVVRLGHPPLLAKGVPEG